VCSNDEFYTIIDLPQGDHQYRFLVDGQWMCDPHGVSCFINCAMQRNSILSVKTVIDRCRCCCVLCRNRAGVGDNGLPCSVVSVRESDFEVFEALAVDSVSTGEEKYKGAA
jgi:5'-AMP-activated protein kinase regulatory beta subunit